MLVTLWLLTERVCTSRLLNVLELEWWGPRRWRPAPCPGDFGVGHELLPQDQVSSDRPHFTHGETEAQGSYVA